MVDAAPDEKVLLGGVAVEEVSEENVSVEVSVAASKRERDAEGDIAEEDATVEPPAKKRKTRAERAEERGPCIEVDFPKEAEEALDKVLSDLCKTHGVTAEFSDEEPDEDETPAQNDSWEAKETAEDNVDEKKNDNEEKHAENKNTEEKELAQEKETVVEKTNDDENNSAEEKERDETKVAEEKGTAEEAAAEENALEETAPAKEEEDQKKNDEDKPDEDFVKIGAVLEGNDCGTWKKCTVRGIRDDSVRIRWDHDQSEERVCRDDLRKEESSNADEWKSDEWKTDEWKEEPKGPAEVKTLYIFNGSERGRMEMELEVQSIGEKKVEGHFSSKPHPSPPEGDGLGRSVMVLLNDGEMKPKIIGKKGSMRKRIAKSTGSNLEILGNDCHIIGTRVERTAAAKVVDILQTLKGKDNLHQVPDELADVSLVARVPDDAFMSVLGSGRANLNAVEEDTSCLTFWLAPGFKAVGETNTNDNATFAEGDEVEAMHLMMRKWRKATVVSQEVDEDGDTMVRIRWEDGKEMDMMPTPAKIRKKLSGAAATTREVLTKARPLLVVGHTVRDRTVAHLRVLDLVAASGVEGCDGFAEVALAVGDADSQVDSMKLTAEDVTKCQAEGAASRLRAIGVAARCIIGLVGECLYFLGSGEGRALGKQYARLWLQDSQAEVDEAVEVEFCSDDQKRNLSDDILAQVERETETFCMWDQGAALAGLEDTTRLVVFGAEASGRKAAVAQIKVLQDIKSEETAWAGGWDQEDSKGWGEEKKWEEDGNDDKTDNAAESKTTWDDKKDTKEWDEEKKWEEDKNDVKKWDDTSKSSKPSWDDKKDDKGWGEEKKWEEDKNDTKKWDDTSKSTKSSWDDKKDTKSWGDEKKWGEEKNDDNKWDDTSKSSTPSWDDKKDAKGWGEEKKWEDDKNDAKTWDDTSKSTKPSWDDKKDAKSWGDEKKWGEEKNDDNKWGDTSMSSKPSWDDKKDANGWGEEKKWEEDNDSKKWDDTSKTDNGAESTTSWTSRAMTSRAVPSRAAPELAATTPWGAASRPMTTRAVPSRAMTAEDLDAQAVRMLESAGFPTSIGAWIDVQKRIFGSHPQLPTGWIRIWSRSQKSIYFMRISDQFTTFEEAEAMRG